MVLKKHGNGWARWRFGASLAPFCRRFAADLPPVGRKNAETILFCKQFIVCDYALGTGGMALITVNSSTKHQVKTSG
jgi:hypothetical protein